MGWDVMMEQAIGAANGWTISPWLWLGIFIGCSVLMIWRLETMGGRGMEGTVLGTLVMPYCSGIGNLMLVFLIGREESGGKEVIVNGLVNNVTNMTLLIGLPLFIWTAPVKKRKSGRSDKQRRHARLQRLSLMFTMAAGLFFAGATWSLTRDGTLDLGDGMVLAGLFVFWQMFHVYEVLKGRVRQNQGFDPRLLLDMTLLVAGGFGIYWSLDQLLLWFSNLEVPFLKADQVGWLSGWLMVLPNALLALYYGWKRQPEVVYSSQAGDGHICIPLCIGLAAILKPTGMPGIFEQTILLLSGIVAVHLFLLLFWDSLPRTAAGLLVLVYGIFLYFGLVQP